MKTQIWAHRGSSAYAPENTLEAFRLAADMHADGIELDVHLTADHCLAVCHDGEISRTSDGSGKIAEMTLAELRRFSFAAGFRETYKNVMLPTLDDVYKLIEPGTLTVNVELKAAGDEFLSLVHECEIRCGMCGRVIYSSFNHFNLTAMRKLDPDAFVAPLYGDGIVLPWKYAASFGAKALHPHFASVYAIEDYVKNSHDLGIRVHPWTVDDEDNIRRLLDLGVDAIITNRPDAALRLRGSDV
jgi:glycerophosphoryl diester phosphodiesterase